MKNNKVLEIALAIVVNDDGEVLIIKRKKPEQIGNIGRLKWAFPGGKVSEYETHEETVIQETLEETGHYVEVITLISKRKHPQFPARLNYFECKLTTEATTQLIDDHEIEQIAWVHVNNLFDYFETDIDKKVAKFLKVK